MEKINFKVQSAEKVQRLDQFLFGELNRYRSHQGRDLLSKSQIRKLIVSGSVYLNRRRVRIASKTVFENAEISIWLNEDRLMPLSTLKDQPFLMSEAAILFEDEFLIVLNKPPGLPTQPTLDDARANLYGVARDFLTARGGSVSYLGLHHRLDKETSGAILFTKKKEANAGIGQQFAEHQIQKTYFALAEKPDSPLPAQWTSENYLAREKGKKSKMKVVRAGGDYALTKFRLVETLPGGLFIEAQPQTGRMHQIRIHLASLGAPIFGDFLYGARIQGAPRVLLHAACLTFRHPILKTALSIDCPLPEDFQTWLLKIKKPHG